MPWRRRCMTGCWGSSARGGAQLAKTKIYIYPPALLSLSGRPARSRRRDGRGGGRRRRDVDGNAAPGGVAAHRPTGWGVGGVSTGDATGLNCERIVPGRLAHRILHEVVAVTLRELPFRGYDRLRRASTLFNANHPTGKSTTFHVWQPLFLPDVPKRKPSRRQRNVTFSVVPRYHPYQ